MKIVALDVEAISFDGLSWNAINELGEFTSYSSSKREEGFERSKDANAVIVNKYFIDSEFLDKAPNIKYVGVSATGVNNVDLEACEKKA